MTTNKYQMWLTFNAEREKIQIPVLPETIQIKNGSGLSSVNIAGLGEIVVMQNCPALQISFSSFLPAKKFPGLQVGKITPPLSLIKKINAWKESQKPVHFIVTACGINIYAAIDNFSYSESGGDVGTYQYSLSLKEYREISIRQVKVSMSNVFTSGDSSGVSRAVTTHTTATVQKENTRVDNTVRPSTYTTQPGDCLWNLAKKYYNDGSKSKDIYEANKSIIGSRPNVLLPGLTLTFP